MSTPMPTELTPAMIRTLRNHDFTGSCDERRFLERIGWMQLALMVLAEEAEKDQVQALVKP